MMENQSHPQEANKTSNRKWIALAIGGGCAILACMVLVVAVIAARLLPVAKLLANPVPTGINLRGPIPTGGVSIPYELHPQANDNRMGDPNAPIQMTLYSDFQCPYCRNFWQETEPQIVGDYITTGKVLFIYRSAGNWVSRNSGGNNQESENSAMAAYCAGDQNKFWEYHDVLFSNVKGENVGSFSDPNLQTFAQDLGLDMNQFNSCYSSKKYASRVNQDYQDAIAAGIQGTPFFVLTYKFNGQTKTTIVDGDYPYSTFQQAIDAALNGQ